VKVKGISYGLNGTPNGLWAERYLEYVMAQTVRRMCYGINNEESRLWAET
jgi:hypothetical protein